MIGRIAIVTLGLLAAMPLMAQEESAADAAGPWSGKVSLGYQANTGNTEDSALNAEFELAWARGDWRHELYGRANNNSRDNETTAENYRLRWTSDYAMSEESYAFGRLDWRKDRFGGFDTQFSQTVGYGRHVLDTGVHTLDLELSLGAKQLEAADGTESEDFIVRGDLGYIWTFSETANFSQDLLVEAGETNTLIESVTAVRARLIGALALVASYTIRNNSDVPVGSEKTDTLTAVSLEYAF